MSDQPLQEPVIAPVPAPVPELFYPTTHEEIENLHLFFVMRHFISEQLLNRAMHSLLNILPDAGWDWVANIDMNNVNKDVDPAFDVLQNDMNSQQTFKYDITWETKPIFVWILRQLNYIANHGISKFKNLYLNLRRPQHMEGFWQLETDPTQNEI